MARYSVKVDGWTLSIWPHRGGYRVVARNAEGQRKSGRHWLPSEPGSYERYEDAVDGVGRIKVAVAQKVQHGVSVLGFWEEWTDEDHAIWGTGDEANTRRTRQTILANKSKTKHFVEIYGHLPMRSVDELIIREYRTRHNARYSNIQGLNVMFGDAASDTPAVVAFNPFAGPASAMAKNAKANRARRKELPEGKPPSLAQTEAMLALAERICPPDIYVMLYASVWCGWRPGEAHAAKWEFLEPHEHGASYWIDEQFNQRLRVFTPPKWESRRWAEIPPDALALIEGLRPSAEAYDSPFIFNTERFTHWTSESVDHWWSRVRHLVDGKKLYLATRHFFAHYAYELADPPLPKEQIAYQLGHKDGGDLVHTTYGHKGDAAARRAMRELHAQRLGGNVIPLRKAA